MNETEADLDRLIEEMLIYLDLPLDEAYRAGIKLNLQAAQRIAAPMLAVELDDEAEPAPVFRA
ncbi:MAG: DUF4089 domain-containing protein [Pseudomonadota bacterium]